MTHIIMDLSRHRYATDPRPMARRRLEVITAIQENPYDKYCVVCGEQLPKEAYGYRIQDITSAETPVVLYSLRACDKHRDALDERMASVIARLQDPEFLLEQRAALVRYKASPPPEYYFEMKYWGSHSLRPLYQALIQEGLRNPDRDGGIMARIQIRWRQRISKRMDEWQRWMVEVTRVKDPSHNPVCHFCGAEIRPDDLYGFRIWKLGQFNTSPSTRIWEFLACYTHQSMMRKNLKNVFILLHDPIFLKENEGYLFGHRELPFPYLMIQHTGDTALSILIHALENSGFTVEEETVSVRHHQVPLLNAAEISRSMEEQLIRVQRQARFAEKDRAVQEATALLQQEAQLRKEASFLPVGASMQEIVDELHNLFEKEGIEWSLKTFEERYLVIQVGKTEIIVTANREQMRQFRLQHLGDNRPRVWMSSGSYAVLKKVRDLMNKEKED